jgi:small acid-soluble spore protein H (minor)
MNTKNKRYKEGVDMDMNRVKQIVSSPADIPVHYHGVSVWIDSYDEKNGTATVHMRDSHLHEKREVPVEELEEE